MMTISVLMSVYKAEKSEYLSLALRSIWDEQSVRPTQIIIVEDGDLGSELQEVIIAFEEKVTKEGAVFTRLKNETNLGLTKSLNKGITAVTSDLIARMDSDDRATPCRFELQMRYLQEHPEVDVCGGSLQEFDAAHDNLNVRHYPLTHEECAKYIVKASPFAHPAVMMRTKMFKEGLKYDERYRTSQDIKLWFDALLHGCRFGNIDDVCLYFRREGDVFKRRSRAKAKNEFRIYMSGIYRLKGIFCLDYFYPIARFIFRNLPVPVVKMIYGSKLRNGILQK